MLLRQKRSQQHGRGMARSIGETQMRLGRSHTVTPLNSMYLY